MTGVTTYAQLREAAEALAVIDDLARAVFRTGGFGTSLATLQYPFGGNSKRELTEAQTAVVLRALYEQAANTLAALGVTP